MRGEVNVEIISLISPIYLATGCVYLYLYVST